MKKIFLGTLIIVLAFFSGCSTAARNTVMQTSTIDALLAGVYDGDMSCRELLQHGDFGIGTFNRLDGEMIVLDGKVYQVKVDGKVYVSSAETRTPFACVCNFQSDRTFSILRGANYKAVKSIIDDCIPNQNIFCAIKISGRFKLMKTRSVAAQQKPYRPLAVVIKDQAVFNMKNISGTIVGFRSPPFVKGVNVPGYHLHFISDDHKQGGHILNFELVSGTCEVDICNRYFLVLPDDEDRLKDLDLSKDRSEELEKVER